VATVRSQGGLLPADILARIRELDPELGGLASGDYNLAPNERLGEAIAGSWSRLIAAWEVFSEDRDKLPEDEVAGKLTRERWQLPLFSELGYGRLIQQNAIQVHGETFPVFSSYNHSPIHLVGARVPLDRRTAGVRGAADQSPHSLVQNLLNRSDEHLWGIVSNGLSLRLLRDNLALTRQAYLEFDLESIFAGEAYEDFALLWLCAHQSRLEAEKPEDCWLEHWTEAALRDGTRALTDLRQGVERAIEQLGRGFLAHQANPGLQEALKDGSLDAISYYRQLLRQVYRLLFLFVAEDRDVLLLPEDGSPRRRKARETFDSFYGTRRLRKLSVRRRGGRAYDLYEQLKLVSSWLHKEGQPALALPVLGSQLWDPSTTVHLSEARISNDYLLSAIRELAFVEDGHRPIDFRNLGAEELGSVYESLLELHPEIDRESATFELVTASGNERKQTGSYYTPTSLIGSLLETALDPVIDQAVGQPDPESALLDLTVCDPACGSGHFLIAAANRLAKRLAGIREGDTEPSPEAMRKALRDVVSRCIHGVDVNPMAVELCKVSLWLEALEPGRPLSFLDDQVRCGNSLLGSTPALINAGVPDDAFKPLLGDDPEIVKSWKKRNKSERHGQLTIDSANDDIGRDHETLSVGAEELRDIDDESLEGVEDRRDAFESLIESEEHERLELSADAWCAAFVTEKRNDAVRISTDTVRRAANNGESDLTDEELKAIRESRNRYSFLHWHVEFPHIFRPSTDGDSQGWTGGFDCVLGNPPWEHTELKEKEFFAVSAPEIAEASTGAKRKRMIEQLAKEDPGLYSEFVTAKRLADGVSHFVRNSDRYPLCGRGRINTYAIFAEGMRATVAPTGRAGIIVPTGIATDDTTKHFFADMTEKGSLVSLFDFENRKLIFPGIDSRIKFCLLTVGGSARPPGTPGEFSFFLHEIADLGDPERRFELTAEDIELVNPNTRTCPIFRTRRDAEITKGIYRRVSVLLREGDPEGNPWGIKFRQGLFNMTSDSSLFQTRNDLEEAGWTLVGNIFVKGDEKMLPLYEAKMIHHFDHQWATYEDGEFRDVTSAEKSDLTFYSLPRYWVPVSDVDSELGDWQQDWILGWRGITNTTNERTLISSVFPKSAVGNSIAVALSEQIGAKEAAWLIGEANSFAHDFVARLKAGGSNLNFFIIYQLPMHTPSTMEQRAPWADAELGSWVENRVKMLSDVLGSAEPQDSRRKEIRCELDAAFFHIYGISRHDVEYVMDTFPIIKRKDEQHYGEYLTKRLILEEYDRMSAQIAERQNAGEPAAKA
jgi:hypothetical protein